MTKAVLSPQALRGLMVILLTAGPRLSPDILAREAHP